MDLEALLTQQHRVVARRQLREHGVDAHRVDRQARSGRWTLWTPTVVCCFTGTPTREQQEWIAVLHPSYGAHLAGLTAARRHGLARWDDGVVDVLLPLGVTPPGPLDGVRYRRTRRALDALVSARPGPPTLRLEPAVLLHAATTASARAAQGLLAASVQQRLTTSARLREELEALRPVRRSPLLAEAIAGIAGGAQAMSELDVGAMCRDFAIESPARQRRRRDAGGRLRFTDCEWDLSDGRTLVLEVDGSFHMQVEHWEDDLRRQRELTTAARFVVRASAREIRDEPDALAHYLISCGVPRVQPGVCARRRKSDP